MKSAMPMIISMRYYSTVFQKIKEMSAECIIKKVPGPKFTFNTNPYDSFGLYSSERSIWPHTAQVSHLYLSTSHHEKGKYNSGKHTCYGRLMKYISRFFQCT